MVKKQYIIGLESTPMDFSSRVNVAVPQSIKTNLKFWAADIITDDNLADKIRWFAPKLGEIPRVGISIQR